MQQSSVFATGLVLYVKNMAVLQLSRPQISDFMALHRVGQAMFYRLVISGWIMRRGFELMTQ